jgi:transcriptional regulator with XRE-family HTH domain
VTSPNATTCKEGRVPIRPRRAQKEGTKSLSAVLARNARQERNLRRLSQDDVAERMTALGHAWSRQTTSDVERGHRNVTIDELLGLALVLGAPIGALLDPGLHMPDFRAALRTAVDPGDPDVPYIGPQNADDAWPKELPGTAGTGIPRAALQALMESRLVLRLAWDDRPTGIHIEETVGDLEDYMTIVNEFRRRRREQEEGQNERNDQEARRDVDLPIRGHAKWSPSDDQ